MALTITKHARERYAERIMDRDHPTDIAVFIRDHEGKIQNDIEKMLEYGTLLYEGKSIKDPKRTVGVTINGSWVVIWDTKEFTVITLYCIDLGVGDEVNKAFISNAHAQIDQARTEMEETTRRTAEYIKTYQELIDNAEASLAKYRKLVKDLESQIIGCRQMIASMSVDNEVANDRVRERVEILIGKQKF